MAPGEPGRAETIAVQVVHCPGPGVADEVTLRLGASATVRDALAASGMLQRHVDVDPKRVGVWGRLRPLDAVLRDGDRVEVYRRLQVDPKEARRLRHRAQRGKPGTKRR